MIGLVCRTVLWWPWMSSSARADIRRDIRLILGMTCLDYAMRIFPRPEQFRVAEFIVKYPWK